jgi:hypothetical protein
VHVSIYRDALAGLKSQVATKRSALASRARALSPIRRALVPRALKKRIDHHVSVASATEEDLETLTAAEAALDALHAVYDEIDALGPTVRDCPFHVEDPPRPVQAPPWLEELTPQLAFRGRLTARIERVAPGSDVLRWGDRTYLVRMRIAGAPFLLRARAEIHPVMNHIVMHNVMLRTSVPEGLGRLELGPSAPILHAVGKALGIVEDREVGDPDFDRAYVIQADEDVAAILTADVRRALRAVGEARLFVVGGVCELSWGGPPSAELLPDAAIGVLLAIRAAIDGA